MVPLVLTHSHWRSRPGGPSKVRLILTLKGGSHPADPPRCPESRLSRLFAARSREIGGKTPKSKILGVRTPRRMTHVTTCVSFFAALLGCSKVGKPSGRQLFVWGVLCWETKAATGKGKTWEGTSSQGRRKRRRRRRGMRRMDRGGRGGEEEEEAHALGIH